MFNSTGPMINDFQAKKYNSKLSTLLWVEQGSLTEGEGSVQLTSLY
jgi:hypothetical protein